MSDLAIAPVLAAASAVIMGIVFAAAAARMHKAFTGAKEFLALAAGWTLQVRNEEGFHLYRRNVAKEALERGGFASVWSEFLDGVHVRYDERGQPVAEAATEALEKVKHDLAATFARSHKVTRLCSLALAVLGLATAVLAVGAGVLAAAPLLEAEPAAPAKALGELFSAGGVAFVASALGLLAALAFRAIERWQLQRVEVLIDALGNHLRTFVTFRGEPYYLAELTHTLRHERAGVKDFGREVLEKLGVVGEAARRSAALATEAAARGDELRGAVEASAERVVQAVERVERGTEEGSRHVVEAQNRVVEGQNRVVEGQDRVVAAQERLVEGQDRVVASHVRLVEGQDFLVDGQSRLIDGQSLLVAGQSRLVEAQDRVVASQERLVAGQSRLVEGQDRVVAGQGRLVEGQDRVAAAQDRVAASQERAVEAQKEQDDVLRAVLAGIVGGREDSLAASRDHLSASREHLATLRSLESTVRGLEVQIVEALGRATEAFGVAETRVVGGLRGAFERHTTDVRLALDNLGSRFGSVVHASGRDLQESLAALSGTLATELRGVRPVHYADAVVFTREDASAASPHTFGSSAATVVSVDPAAPYAEAFEGPGTSAGSIVINESSNGFVRDALISATPDRGGSAGYDPDTDLAREHVLAPAFAAAVAIASAHVEGDGHPGRVESRERAPEAGSSDGAGPIALESIPPTMQVMLGCLDLLQSGLRGLGTIRAQFEYLERTCDRLRRLILDIQAVALPLPEGDERPEWWNARSVRVAGALTRLDEVLEGLRSQAQGYEAIAEARLAENFVQLGRAVEALWKDKEVPALLENLWGGSRAPSQLVKAIAGLKVELAPLCRSLLHAQRQALALEKALCSLWDAGREPRLGDEEYWRVIEELSIPAVRRGKILSSSRRRVVFPHGLVSGEVAGVLGSLAKLVEETNFCIADSTGKRAGEGVSGDALRHYAKFPKVG